LIIQHSSRAALPHGQLDFDFRGYRLSQAKVGHLVRRFLYVKRTENLQLGLRIVFAEPTPLLGDLGFRAGESVASRGYLAGPLAACTRSSSNSVIELT
jgi:hypothetical protein